MDCTSLSQEHPLADSEGDAIARLQDLIPELESSYDIIRSIGHGTFSRVYLAKLKSTTKNSSSVQLALKHIIPTSHPSRVHMELQCLHKLGGLNNVVGVWACHRHLNHIALAMPYIPHDSTGDYMGCLSVSEVRDYLANLLSAVLHVHQHNILHRDIKPANFLYHRATNRYCLVDFGLAQEMNNLRGTPSSRHRHAVPPPRPPTPLPPTPHLYTNRPVKRKLPVDIAMGEFGGSSNKRAKASPPPPPPLNVLTAAASRLNSSHPHLTAGVRRSPRKWSFVCSPSKKENYEAHTGLTFEATGETRHKPSTTTPQKETVADSPRKPVVNKMNLSPSEKSYSSTAVISASVAAAAVTPQKRKGPLVKESPDTGNTTPRKATLSATAGGGTPQKKNGGRVTALEKTVGRVTPQKTGCAGVTPRKMSGCGVTPQKNTGCSGTVPEAAPLGATVPTTTLTHLELLGPPAPGTVTPRKGAPRAAVQAQWPQDSPSKHTRLAEASRRRDPQKPSSPDSGSGPSVRLNGPPPKLKHLRCRKPLSVDRPSCVDGKRSPVNDLSLGGHQALVDTTTTNTTTVTTSSRLVSLTKASDAFNSTTAGCWELSKRSSCANNAKNALDSKSFLRGGNGADSASCRCYGRGQLCKKCQGRPQQVAARAGTPGFRPPEVLLRHPHQGAGVDIWACGVVSMCLASGRHPFFRAPDDQTALAELCTLFSTKAIRKSAAALDKLFVSNVDRPPLNLMKVCETLRLSCVPDAGGTSTAARRLKQPCDACLQPRVCVCKKDAATTTIDFMTSDSGDAKRELNWEADGLEATASAAATNSPTLDYLRNLTKTNNVCGEMFKSPFRTARSNGSTKSPFKVKKESADVKVGNSAVGIGLEDCRDESILSTNETNNSKDVNNTCFGTPITPTRSLPPPVWTSSCTSKVGGDTASPNRRKRPPLYAAPYPKSFYNLLERLLDLYPANRISAEQALQHPFLQGARINSTR